MPRFFTENISDITEITGEQARHISRSLRMKTGDEIVLCDSQGYDYLCMIQKMTAESVVCRLIEKGQSKSEADIDLTLFQAIPKGDKLETIIQKSVELGVNKIVPVITSRCVSRPDKKTFSKKLERYNKISLEAAKQAGRGRVPEITEMVDFNTAISQMTECDIPLMCYENGGKRINSISFGNNMNVALFIGSEGGFSDEEAQYAENNGIIHIWLGERILRCETAPIAAISIIMNLSGNM